MKRFHEYEYDLYMLLVSSQEFRIWTWQNWLTVVDILDPFIKSLHDKVAVRSTQLDSTKKGKTVPYGRLAWDDRSHEKWTHGSPATKEVSPHWIFLGTEFWSPSWNDAQRNNRAPRFFMSVGKVHPRGASWETLFDTFIICAASRDIGEERLRLMRDSILTLSKTASSRLTAYCLRPWGKSWGTGGFSDSIQDLTFAALADTGTNDQQRLGLGNLKDSSQWELLS
jgi:hypothetical protein